MDKVLLTAQKWLSPIFDDQTRKEVQYLIDHNQEELTECFYRSLEFGTGGIRGIMGVGTNRMNIYTVGMATQGLSNYLLKCYASLDKIRVAIGHDSRNNSRLFAESAAGIFAANGIDVLLFESMRPTPEVSFAIRQYQCQSGVMVTASHNPKEYNGYKVYWGDGAQIIAPHDKNIIDEVNKITDISQVKFNGPKEKITIIGSETDDIYTDNIVSLSLSQDAIKRQSDIKIVYTPIHGTGVNLVPMVLGKMGFTNVITIDEQCIPDGNFPTVISPNPEEPEALSMAVAKAKECDADIVMGTDPDGDRVGLAVKNKSGEWTLLTGNQSAAILIYYLVSMWKEKGKLQGKEYVVKTIVTTELIADIANHYGVKYFDCLTGFKWIANIIAANEGKMKYIGGGEESYGYLCGEFVRDKDAEMACAIFAEITAWAKDKGMTLYDILMEIYLKFGVYVEKGISLVKKGKAGAEEIAQMMLDYSNNPLKTICGSPVIKVIDYNLSQSKNLIDGSIEKIDFPKSNVLQYFTADKIKVTIRPSGTEPKIKYYISVCEQLSSIEDYEKIACQLQNKVSAIKKELSV